MGSFHIAWSLVKIPNLALSLFVFPLTIGLAIVVAQSMITAMLLTVANRDMALTEPIAGPSQDQSLTRLILFGDATKRALPIICRWKLIDGKEIPPGPECTPDQLDIALHVENPALFNPEEYVKLFNGNVDRIHLCNSCAPDVTIEKAGTPEVETKSQSIYGTILALSPLWNEESQQIRQQGSLFRNNVTKSLGRHYLKLPETPEGIGITDMRASVPVALNIALFVIVALWLALKAHRKVLDYFARNDVLLPLVAACGKSQFYGALWILTGFRVISFLVSGLALVILAFWEILVRGASPLIKHGILSTTLWLITLVAGLTLIALIGSIAELKHRQHALIVLLRYVPITIALLGGLGWTLTLFSTADIGTQLRLAISVVPILGVVPILVAPTLNLPNWVLLVHGALSLVFCSVIARSNSRWFAAHLDEI